MDSSHGVDELATLLGGWSGGDGPLYRKLARALRRTVEGGTLAVGERLPSERLLAAALAVSRTTVVAAYDELRAEGVLDSRRGSGTRVNPALAPVRSDGWVPGGRSRPIYQRLIDGPSELISLSCVTAEGLPEVAEAVRDVAAEELPALMAEAGYHPRGLPALRAAIADHHTRRGLPTRPEEIVVTTGAQQAVALVSGLYLRNGSPVLVESPSFAGCLDLLRATGADLLTAPLDFEGVDPVAVREALRERGPHLLYVMPSYHNPTGVMMSAARRREIAGLAARYGVPVLEDSAYTGMRAPDEPGPMAAFAPPEAEVVTVESLAKVGWAGLRIGWLRAPAEIAERISRRKALTDLGSPLLDQAVAARLIPRLDGLALTRSRMLGERLALLEERLREALPSWTWRRPDGGSALWVRLPGTSAQVFAQIALRHGVEIVPGSVMAPGDGETYREFFRLPFGFGPQVLEELVRRLARAWTELRRHGPCEEAPLRVVV
ncbi:DNA-binding transcriptional MocR family regulator [Spinactinospora alkalitolerans]|uniref:DNA-binding transcriptional MocR family regulator n=1 Tax=Spinactinospora alkalitolerans TaxID=687207 RepID=A0A852TVT4_9ACTN|nr:PLP-dependent aminotransferase family protein [Spinactinospora alkalitolerans]NYE46184.1 DNA-binding transcriptional MocR family regulator [Spinactinospora alkalitolerans]